MNGTFYLNNRGTRWIYLNNGKKDKITLTNKAGDQITRTVQFYELFGNFAVAHISYKGKKIRVLGDEILD